MLVLIFLLLILCLSELLKMRKRQEWVLWSVLNMVFLEPFNVLWEKEGLCAKPLLNTKLFDGCHAVTPPQLTAMSLPDGTDLYSVDT